MSILQDLEILERFYDITLRFSNKEIKDAIINLM